MSEANGSAVSLVSAESAVPASVKDDIGTVAYDIGTKLIASDGWETWQIDAREVPSMVQVLEKVEEWLPKDKTSPNFKKQVQVSRIFALQFLSTEVWQKIAVLSIMANTFPLHQQLDIRIANVLNLLALAEFGSPSSVALTERLLLAAFEILFRRASQSERPTPACRRLIANVSTNLVCFYTAKANGGDGGSSAALFVKYCNPDLGAQVGLDMEPGLVFATINDNEFLGTLIKDRMAKQPGVGVQAAGKTSVKQKCCSASCDNMEAKAGQFSLCSRCRKVCYCSQECQKRAWKQDGHKAKCVAHWKK